MISLNVGDGCCCWSRWRAQLAPHDCIVPDSSARTDINIALTSKVQTNDWILSRECVLQLELIQCTWSTLSTSSHVIVHWRCKDVSLHTSTIHYRLHSVRISVVMFLPLNTNPTRSTNNHINLSYLFAAVLIINTMMMINARHLQSLRQNCMPHLCSVKSSLPRCTSSPSREPRNKSTLIGVRSLHLHWDHRGHLSPQPHFRLERDLLCSSTNFSFK
jgi:hypothetical protein